MAANRVQPPQGLVIDWLPAQTYGLLNEEEQAKYLLKDIET